MVLPGLHLVSERLGYVPPQAVVELAELLGLAPAEVQDTLSFYGFFKQDRAAGPHAGVGLPLAELCRPGRRRAAGVPVREAGHPPGRDHARRPRDAGVCRVPGRLRSSPRPSWRATRCMRI